jgi:hypothetical protein
MDLERLVDPHRVLQVCCRPCTRNTCLKRLLENTSGRFDRSSFESYSALYLEEGMLAYYKVQPRLICSCSSGPFCGRYGLILHSALVLAVAKCDHAKCHICSSDSCSQPKRGDSMKRMLPVFSTVKSVVNNLCSRFRCAARAASGCA